MRILFSATALALLSVVVGCSNDPVGSEPGATYVAQCRATRVCTTECVMARDTLFAACGDEITAFMAMPDYDEVSICFQDCPRTDCMGAGLSDCDCVAACLDGTSLVLREAADRVGACALDHVAGACP